jgi:hypothetical protein
MRTLFEIIEAAKSNQPTTHEECFYALLAYAGLSYFDSSALRKLAFEPSKFLTPERQAEESHRRWKTALDKSPKDWIGWNNDPKNPDYQRFHKMAVKLFDKVAGDQALAEPEQP